MRKYSQFFLCFSFFMLATFFVSSSSAYAVADRCPRHKIKTSVKAKRLKTKFLRASVQGINEYLNSHSVLAFVSNPIDVIPELKFRLKDIGYGRYCVMLDEVRVTYLSAPRIVMPKDYKKSSCEYKLILKHENRHLNVHYKYYDKSVGQYKAFLGRIARDVPLSVPVTTSEEAQAVRDNLEYYFIDKFYTQVGKSIAEMRKLQEKIDSKQEYTFTGRKIDRCAAKEENKDLQNSKVFLETRDE